MKPGTLDGSFNGDKCVCTLFSSVTSATMFEEIRLPQEQTLSGWACLRLPKSPPPPITDMPNFRGTERPGLDMRPDAPGGTPASPRHR